MLGQLQLTFSSILETKWAYINFLAKKNFLVEPAALDPTLSLEQRKKGPTKGCILVRMEWLQYLKKVVLKPYTLFQQVHILAKIILVHFPNTIVVEVAYL